MGIYVDPLMHHGWRLRGHRVASCHLFTDEQDLSALHALASAIGMRPAWFQSQASIPHYDLTPARRRAAVAAGAVELDRAAAVGIWRAWRAAFRARHSLPGVSPADQGSGARAPGM